MKLSDNLKRIRKDNNLSQEQLAEKLGVSRQAVSKWESGQSYPEMDKVLLICKLFNYNIDELMNENVKEVDETKQSKININKYIDDFFAFITKTIDMLSSMKLSQKLKCFIEQIVIGSILFLIFLIIGAIAGSVILGIFGKLSIYYIIRDILKSIYIAFSVVMGTIILLHIFKIRYLDYYEFVKEDSELEKEIDDKTEKDDKNLTNQENDDIKKKIFVEKKKEKIVIRDPNHSQSKFLTGIFNAILIFIKFMVGCVALGFVFTFVSLFCLLVLSFLFVKSGVIFVGSLLCIISCIIINFIILELFYNFIISKKSKKTRMAISFVIALVLTGISIGLILIGITDFKYIETSDEINKIEDVYEFEMTENLSIEYWNEPVEYVEEESDKIKIVSTHSEFLDSIVNNENELISIYFTQNNGKFLEGIKYTIDSINNKQISNYYNPTITIYASKENIEKLQQNREIKHQYNLSRELEIQELNNTVSEKEIEIYELQNQLEIKENEIDYSQMQVEEKNNMINSLEVQIQEKDNIISALEIQIQDKDNTIDSLEQQIYMNQNN